MTGMSIYSEQHKGKQCLNRKQLWVIALAGIIFTLSGIMALVGLNNSYNPLFATVLLGLLGIIAFWVAVLGDDSGFTTNIPFLPQKYSIVLARSLAFIGALSAFAIAYIAFKDYLSKRK